MRWKSKGFSLIEMLVGLAVFGLITGVIAAVFVLTHRYTRLYHQVSLAQREAVLCMREMSRELLRGRSETLKPAGVAVNATWFLSSQPPLGNLRPAVFDPQGALLWHKWVGIWCQPNGEVRRAEVVLPGLAQPILAVDLTTCPATIADFTSLPRTRRLASRIQRFELSGDAKILTLDVVSEAQQGGNPPTRYHLSSSIFTR